VDFSWLGNVFKGLFSILKKLVHLKWSDLWRGLQDVLHRLKNWYGWYKTHVQQPIQQARANFKKLHDRFILPVIRMVDTIRRITSIVGLFNKRLAAKLNSVFFRIEAALLAPMRAFLNRVNSLGGIMRQFLTPLGYFDRATLLTSLWRDAKYLRVLARHPLAGTMPKAALSPGPTWAEQTQAVKDHANGIPSYISPSVDIAVSKFHKLIDAGVE
jgi:hypothetical protein